MASQQSIVDYLVEQASRAGSVSSRKMFGEHAIHCGGTLVALVSDDRLYLKPTAAGRAFAGDVEEAPAYKGAKPSLVIAEDRWDDAEWLSELFRRSAADMPAPKPKKANRTPW